MSGDELIKEFDSYKNEVLVENNAQTIFDHLNELEKDRTNNEKSAISLNKLKISVADIIRNSIPDANQKLQWDLTFMKLLTNKQIDPELAREMLEDPNLQEIYKAKKDEREKIQRNKNIGLLFEQVFRSIFESKEFKEDGFTIERTSIGSDFGVVYENDILDESGNEIIFKVDEILIELKATGKEYAEMTPTQAEEATRNKENYVLAVFTLGDYEINVESVRKHSRFVVNISEPLTSRYSEFISYFDKKNSVVREQDGIKLYIEDGKVRYQVKSKTWKSPKVLNFNGFVLWIKSKLGTAA